MLLKLVMDVEWPTHDQFSTNAIGCLPMIIVS